MSARPYFHKKIFQNPNSTHKKSYNKTEQLLFRWYCIINTWRGFLKINWNRNLLSEICCRNNKTRWIYSWLETSLVGLKKYEARLDIRPLTLSNLPRVLLHNTRLGRGWLHFHNSATFYRTLPTAWPVIHIMWTNE